MNSPCSHTLPMLWVVNPSFQQKTSWLSAFAHLGFSALALDFRHLHEALRFSCQTQGLGEWDPTPKETPELDRMYLGCKYYSIDFSSFIRDTTKKNHTLYIKIEYNQFGEEKKQWVNISTPLLELALTPQLPLFNIRGSIALPGPLAKSR